MTEYTLYTVEGLLTIAITTLAGLVTYLWKEIRICAEDRKKLWGELAYLRGKIGVNDD
jgi:hypothetical protein